MYRHAPMSGNSLCNSRTQRNEMERLGRLSNLLDKERRTARREERHQRRGAALQKSDNLCR